MKILHNKMSCAAGAHAKWCASLIFMLGIVLAHFTFLYLVTIIGISAGSNSQCKEINHEYETKYPFHVANLTIVSQSSKIGLEAVLEAGGRYLRISVMEL